jgi:single-strand DNA-binding protein
VRVACSSRKKVGDQWEDGDTTFLDVSAWRQLAENMAESVTKGTTITVTGELKQRSWETPEGEKRSAYEVSARSVALDLSRATGSVNTASRNQTDGRDPWAKGDANVEPPF